MKTTTLLLAGLGLMAIGCTEDPETTEPIDTTTTPTTTTTTTTTTTEPIEELEVLTAYMADHAMDLPDVADGWIKSAQSVFDDGVETYFIIDVRKGDKYEPGVVDFEEGHIAGAHSVDYADVVDYEATNNVDDLPVLVVCYTGQTAAHAVTALRLSGAEAYSLKFGMSGWAPEFDVFSPNQANAALDYPGSWSTDAEPALEVFAMPVLETGETDPEAILDARIAEGVLTGFNKIAIPDVLGNLDDYQIVNYWDAKSWDYYGHITGSIRIGPGELTLDTIDALDPDKPIVVWCWTGQTASLVSAWLQVLGYDAYGLLFSSNGMIYDSLEGHKYATPKVGFPYDTGA